MAKFFLPEQLHLSNGIPVILQHFDSPVAATYWWVKTGSADEAEQEAGFAHFLEHMLFKDAAAKETGRASVGKMARAIESLGGDINAYTSFDQTVYHVTCAAQHWEKVLDVFGTMAKPQKFLTQDFENEREVILEELRKNEDSPSRQLFQSLFSVTFSQHPYGKPVIGYEKILKAARTSQLEKFYRSHYVSGRMGLILVGPLHDKTGTRKKSILRYLEKHYGKQVLRRVQVQTKPRKIESEYRAKSNWIVKPFDVNTPTASISFRVPDLAHEDIPAIDLLSSVLGMGELSRLYQHLFYQRALVTDVSGGLYVPKDPGMLYFQAETDSVEKLKPIIEGMFKEFRRLIEDGPTTEELTRAITYAESEKLYASQTVDGMAGRLGFLKYIMGDLNFDQEYLDHLRAVDIGKIKEIAEKYLDERRMSGVFLVPKASDSELNIKEFEDLASRYLRPEINQKKATQFFRTTADQVEYVKLPSGLQVCYRQRSMSHVFSMHASVLGGVRLETPDPKDENDVDWGASYMMALTWNKGTKTKDSKKIASMIEGSASSLEGFSGRNSVGLQVTGLSRDWRMLSELFTEVLLDPVFPEDEVDHSRRVAEDSIKSIEDHSSQLCSKLFLGTLFEHHSYGRIIQGSTQSLSGINSKKLNLFHKLWIKPSRLVVSISGPIKPLVLEAWLNELDQQILARSQANMTNRFQKEILEEAQLKAPRWVERSLGREQTHIIVGGLGTRISSEDRHALRLLQTLLGGQSGRLFIGLREKKSLAYTVSPMSFEGIEKGYIGTYIACAPQKREEAIRGIQNVLEKLAEKGPTAQEMSRAKEFFMGRRAMDLQSDTALAAHYGLELLYQVPHLTEPNLAKKIKSISAKDIQKICKKYYIEPPQVTSVVG